MKICNAALMFLLQGCHLVLEWGPRLVQLIEQQQSGACHASFRLFMSASGDAPPLSAALLQRGTAICWEAPQVSRD